MEQWNRENRPLVTDAHWLSSRNSRSMFETTGKLHIVLEESMEYTSKMFVTKTQN